MSISLFLSDISATYDTGTTNMLSCVNVWEALSANETFIAVSEPILLVRHLQ